MINALIVVYILFMFLFSFFYCFFSVFSPYDKYANYFFVYILIFFVYAIIMLSVFLISNKEHNKKYTNFFYGFYTLVFLISTSLMLCPYMFADIHLDSSKFYLLILSIIVLFSSFIKFIDNLSKYILSIHFTPKRDSLLDFFIFRIYRYTTKKQILIKIGTFFYKYKKYELAFFYLEKASNKIKDIDIKKFVAKCLYRKRDYIAAMNLYNIISKEISIQIPEKLQKKYAEIITKIKERTLHTLIFVLMFMLIFILIIIYIYIYNNNIVNNTVILLENNNYNLNNIQKISNLDKYYRNQFLKKVEEEIINLINRDKQGDSNAIKKIYNIHINSKELNYINENKYFAINDKLQNKVYQISLQYLTILAEEYNNANAQYYLYKIYKRYDGIGKKAMYYLKKSALQNNKYAMFDLADIYLHYKKFDKAKELYEKSAKYGNDKAKNILNLLNNKFFINIDDNKKEINIEIKDLYSENQVDDLYKKILDVDKKRYKYIFVFEYENENTSLQELLFNETKDRGKSTYIRNFIQNNIKDLNYLNQLREKGNQKAEYILNLAFNNTIEIKEKLQNGYIVTYTPTKYNFSISMKKNE